LTALAEREGYRVETMNLNRNLLLSVASGAGMKAAETALAAEATTLEAELHMDGSKLDVYLMLRRVQHSLADVPIGWSGNNVQDLRQAIYFLKCLTYFTDTYLEYAAARSVAKTAWPALLEPVYSEALGLLEDSQPRAVGFTIPFAEVVPGMQALLPRVRALFSDICIALGGAATGLATDDILRTTLEDDEVDCVVRYDADDSFLQLLSAVRGDRSFSEVDNLYTRDRWSPHVQPRTKVSRIRDLRYSFKSPIIEPVNILAAHGCYWDKCVYCCYSAVHGESRSFGLRTAAAILDDVERIHREYGVEEFLLSAEALTGTQTKGFAQGVLERGLEIRWYCFIRPGPWYDLDTLRLMAESGFDSRWSVSIENGCDRILKLMRRGYSKEELVAFLERCRETGVRFGWANIIPDFPGTTYDEAMETYELVARFADRYRLGVSLNRFSLKELSVMGARPQDWGLASVERASDGGLTFESSGGLTEEEWLEIEGRYSQLALRFRPEARQMDNLRALAASGASDGWHVELRRQRFAQCSVGLPPSSEPRTMVFPTAWGEDPLYFQYNIHQDFARIAVLGSAGRLILHILLAHESQPVTLDGLLDEIGRQMECDTESARQILLKELQVLVPIGVELTQATPPVKADGAIAL